MMMNIYRKASKHYDEMKLDNMNHRDRSVEQLFQEAENENGTDHFLQSISTSRAADAPRSVFTGNLFRRRILTQR